MSAAVIDAGEVVSRRRLAPEGVHGLAALVPKGSVAVAVARDEHTPPLERGQRVNVLTTAGLDPAGPGLGTDADGAPVEAQRVAKNALVVDVADDRVLIAVRDDESGTVAAALLNGEKYPVTDWNAAQLSKLPKTDFANDYAYNKFEPGPFGIRAKMGAAATVTLPAPASGAIAGLRYIQLKDVDGQIFSATLGK